MKTKIFGLFFVLLILHLFNFTFSYAQSLPPDFYYDVTRGIGSRALGMAGAFVGIADDAFTTYWNPAGVPFVERSIITNGFGVNNGKYWTGHIGYHSSVGDITIMRRDESGRLCWYGNEGKGLRDVFMFTQGIPIGKYFSLGFNLKGISANSGDTVGYGCDLGLLFRTKSFRLGVMLQDIYSKIGQQLEGIKYRVGVGIGPFSTVMIGSQIEVINVTWDLRPGGPLIQLPVFQTRIGVEGWLLKNHLGLRAGYFIQPLSLYNSLTQGQFSFPNQQAITAGVTFKSKYFTLDYAYMAPLEANSEINNSHWISTSFMWGKTKADIAAEEKAKLEAMERDRRAREMLLIMSFAETIAQKTLEITQKDSELEALQRMRGSRDEVIRSLETELEKVRSDSMVLAHELDMTRLTVEKTLIDSEMLSSQAERLKAELLTSLVQIDKTKLETLTEKEKAEALKRRIETMRATGTVDPLLKETIAKGISKEINLRDVSEGLLLRFNRDTFFSGSSLGPAAYKSLDVVIKALNDYQGHIVTINGYTDSTGSKSLNMKVSLSCAKAMASYFIGKGIPEDKIFANGCGPDSPIAPNATKTGRKKNRRIEIIIYKQ